jgi:hypothetical protein
MFTKYIQSKKGRIFRMIADDPASSRWHDNTRLHTKGYKMPYQYVIQTYVDKEWHNVLVSKLYPFESTSPLYFMMVCQKDLAKTNCDNLFLTKQLLKNYDKANKNRML